MIEIMDMFNHAQRIKTFERQAADMCYLIVASLSLDFCVDYFFLDNVPARLLNRSAGGGSICH